jgi:hypothetical protein
MNTLQTAANLQRRKAVYIGRLRDRDQVTNEMRKLYRSLRRRAGETPGPNDTAVLADVLTRLAHLVPESAKPRKKQ